MGAQSLARFTGGAHSDAVPTFLETLEREAEDPTTCAASDCARSPGSREQDLGDFRTRPDADGPPAAAGPTGPGELRRSGREHPKPIPRWNVHFGILKMTERAPRLLISPLAPNCGRPLQCGLEICTSHLGFSLVFGLPGTGVPRRIPSKACGVTCCCGCKRTPTPTPRTR